MKCQKCNKNEANVQIEIKKFGAKVQLLLCDMCAKQEGIFSTDYMDLDFLPFLTLEDLEEERVCKTCGTKATEFLNTGYLGCRNCYIEFKDLIETFIKRFQGGYKHIGKRAN